MDPFRRAKNEREKKIKDIKKKKKEKRERVTLIKKNNEEKGNVLNTNLQGH